jgi:hypothetical protein
VIFTASQKLYADKVIDLIDPKKRVGHRLYREHCIVINKSYYLKNLSILGRNLKEVVIVDVLFGSFRIIILREYCSRRISTGLSRLRGMRRIGSCAGCQPF